MTDKYNAMPESGALWHERFRAVAAAHPEIQASHLMIDAAAAHLVRDPAQSEEVTQDVLLEVWRDAAKFDPGRGSATAWVIA